MRELLVDVPEALNRIIWNIIIEVMLNAILLFMHMHRPLCICILVLSFNWGIVICEPSR